MELDISDTCAFFEQLMTIANDDSVHISTFIDGCMKMKGNARSIDIQLLSFQCATLHKALDELMSKVTDLDLRVKSN